jgi:hypothetical protein
LSLDAALAMAYKQSADGKKMRAYTTLGRPAQAASSRFGL